VVKAENYNKKADEVKDVKLSSNADRLRRYEVSLPFDNIAIGAFFEIINRI